MADHHPQVSEVIIFQVNDHNKFKNNISTTANGIIELRDDVDDDEEDDDCVFVKSEMNLMPRGNHKKDAICVDEYCKEDKNLNENPKVGRKKASIGTVSIQCVDDYDDENDEVRIVTVRPSIGTVSIQCVDDYDDENDEVRIVTVRPSRRKTLGGCSIIEVGESSGLKFGGNDEVGDETDPVEIMFLCEICADSKPQKESFRIKGCSHSYCSDCMQSYVGSKLLDGVSRINCPVPSCCGVLEPEYCREILPFEVFVRWGNLLCESVILASEKFYCPFKDCSTLLIDDGGEKVTKSECPNCFRLFCAQCKVAWHQGIECAEYQSLSKDEREKEDIMLRELAKHRSWQRCPSCKFYVEKSQGCLYMKCRCGVAFCYNCGSIYADHRFHYCQKCGR